MAHGAPGEPGADPELHTSMDTAMQEIAVLRRELTEAVTARNGLQVGHDRLERVNADRVAALRWALDVVEDNTDAAEAEADPQFMAAWDHARDAIEAAS